jgi:hypothetical protein
MGQPTTGTAPAQGAGTGTDATAQGATPEAQGAAEGQGGGVDVDALVRKNAELERDNREYRRSLKAQADADKARQEAGQSESEKLATKVADLERQLADRTTREQAQGVRLAAVTSATRLGFRNPEIAYRMLDMGSVEFDANGSPKNVDALLTTLAKAEPYLVTPTDFGGGTRGTSAAPTGEPSFNDIIRAAAKR